MGRLKKFWQRVIDVSDDFLAYLLTIIGILLSNYLPLLKTIGHINLDIDYMRLAISAIVALMIIGRQESLDIDDSGTTSKAREGRKKRFVIRMFNALSQGIAWSTIMDMTK